MLGLIQIADPDGNPVYASPEGAEVLFEQGYTTLDEVTAVDTDDDLGDHELGDGDPPNPDGDPPETQGDSETQGDGDVPVKDPAAPRGNASREKWVAYAEQIGLQVAAEDSRADIITAVAALEQ